jgi:hypothetical protein
MLRRLAVAQLGLHNARGCAFRPVEMIEVCDAVDSFIRNHWKGFTMTRSDNRKAAAAIGRFVSMGFAPTDAECAPFTVRKAHSGTEDGFLWYVYGPANELLDGGYASEESARYGALLLRDGECCPSAAMGASLPRPERMPQVHTFESTREAYNASQCRDGIHDGDILLVPSESAAAVMVSAWPTAPTMALSGEQFHCLANGIETNAIPHPWREGVTDDYSASFAALDAAIADWSIANGALRIGEFVVSADQVPVVARYAREWASDCQWSDDDIGATLDSLTDVVVISHAAAHYGNGIRGLVSDALYESELSAHTAVQPIAAAIVSEEQCRAAWRNRMLSALAPIDECACLIFREAPATLAPQSVWGVSAVWGDDNA